ncbi:hypothetical protein [Streptomyces sp. NBC_01602]|uniref:hypothetical protein n=1 Tax=Streptomyces sp. NBC_01602 TaxID=2975893 RepID=UPI0038690AF6|nr:hypothetical protein OG955_00145 [Streptomyces sp. NBC_01602]
MHGIVAPNLDRLARELVVQEAALAQCWKHGGRAFMADQGEILPDDQAIAEVTSLLVPGSTRR